jgi:branched-chain amino acid transport system permease protein
VFFVALLVHGLLAGALYALLALAFVVVYKASRLINFALGDFAMFAARLAATGFHGLGLGLVGALGLGCAGMVALALGVNRLVWRLSVTRINATGLTNYQTLTRIFYKD